MRAISTIEPLTPELEAMTNTSDSVGTGQVVEPRGDTGIALEDAGAEDARWLAAEDHHIAQRDPVGRDQPARAASNLHRESLGVAGPERLHDTTGLEGRDDEVGRLLDRPGGLLADRVDDGSEGTEVGVGADGRGHHSRPSPLVVCTTRSSAQPSRVEYS